MSIIDMVTTSGQCAVVGCTSPQTDGLCAMHRAEWENGTLPAEQISDDVDVLGVNR